MLLHATKRLYGSLRLLQTVLRSTSNESFARTDWFEIPGTADVGSEVWELNVGTVLGQVLEPQHLTCSFEMILDTQPIGRHMDAVLLRHRHRSRFKFSQRRQWRAAACSTITQLLIIRL